MSLEEIHRKICEGYDIKVTDAKSDEDITAKVLMQVLLEYEPTKLNFFSSELLTQVIRVNDSILKEFFEGYFGKALSAFCESKKGMEDFLRHTPWMPSQGSNPFAASFGSMNPFANMFGGAPRSSSDDASRLADEIAGLRKEVEDLKKQSK